MQKNINIGDILITNNGSPGKSMEVTHTPGQTPVKSPDQKKHKAEHVEVVQGAAPEMVPERVQSLDTKPTLIHGEESPTPATPMATPRDLSQAFDAAAHQQVTPKVPLVEVLSLDLIWLLFCFEHHIF